jgi:hypothetical protein
VLRGGSWNNNPDNVRSSARNNNHPDNRNNNIGFRVLCSSHIEIFSVRCLTVMALSELPTGYGLLVEAGDGWMAQVSPVRT